MAQFFTILVTLLFFFAVTAVAYFLHERFLPLQKHQVRMSRLWMCMFGLAAWTFVDVSISYFAGPVGDNIPEGPWSFLLPAIYFFATLYYLNVPGIDILPEHLIFRRLSGRKLTIDWAKIQSVRLSRWRHYLQFETSLGKTLGVPANAVNVRSLIDILRDRGVDVPTDEEIETAVQGSSIR